MDESALQNRLARIERRQSLVLALLAGIYLFGGLWILIRETTAVTVWNASAVGVALAILALAVGISRRRRAGA
ncbi:MULTISPECIES: hypothetical protein [Salinibaculum]|uniref:hypothetical protein n=1 Tax=Salinibaculum TaxID=2732368 RepID=UPI0030D111AC